MVAEGVDAFRLTFGTWLGDSPNDSGPSGCVQYGRCIGRRENSSCHRGSQRRLSMGSYCIVARDRGQSRYFHCSYKSLNKADGSMPIQTKRYKRQVGGFDVP